MKTLSNIRYILFAIILLGAFANFAQNEYGLALVNYCSLMLSLVSLIHMVAIIKIIWREKKISAVLISLALICIPTFFIVAIISSDDAIFQIPLLCLLAIVLIEIVVVIITNWRKSEVSNLFVSLESLGLLLISLGLFMKWMHWPGANPFMLIGTIIFFFIYLFMSLKVILTEFKNGTWIAIFYFMFYLNLSIGLLYYTFKTLHFPGTYVLGYATVFLLLILLIPLVLNIKFKYGSQKIGFGNFLKQNKGIMLFMFFYSNYFALYIFLQVIGIGPKYYSLSSTPAFEKMIEKSNGNFDQKMETYAANYSNFLENRFKSLDEK